MILIEDEGMLKIGVIIEKKFYDDGRVSEGDTITLKINRSGFVINHDFHITDSYKDDKHGIVFILESAE